MLTRKKRSLRRNDAIALLILGTFSTLWWTGCAQIVATQPGLRIYTATRLHQTPWIEREIRAFLGLPPVREALGFDPLRYQNPITIHVLEERLNERDALKLFGRTENARVSVKGYLFPGYGGVDVGDTIEVNPKVRVDLRVQADGSISPHPQRRAMLTQLLADPDLLALYRNLLVAHEVAHVGEWYALKHRREVVQYTGHGISNRAEMHILAGLLKAGYIDEALFSRTLAFYVHYLNNEAEAPGAIAAFTEQQLVPTHSATQAVP